MNNTLIVEIVPGRGGYPGRKDGYENQYHREKHGQVTEPA